MNWFFYKKFEKAHGRPPATSKNLSSPLCVEKKK